MAKIGRTLQDLAAEIQRRAEVKRDFIAPMQVTHMGLSEGKPVLTIENKQAITTLGVNDLAHSQLAEYLAMPAPYYKRMMADAPELLATNVNRWLADKPKDRRMIRTLDGTARAFLSDRYRPLENEDLAEAVLPVIGELGLLVLSCEITDKRLYIKAIDGNITRDVPTGRRMGDASNAFFDTVSPAITIGNSEVGFGALYVETGVYTKVCTNLAMIGTNMRKYHVGGRVNASDEVYALLSDRTRKASDRAIWMQVRDLVKSAFDAAQFAATCQKLGNAAKDQITAPDVTEVIERVGRKFALNEGERKGVLARLIEGGDLTRYGLHAAVTRHSQDQALEYDRSTELERIGGDIIDMPANDWNRLAAA